MGVWIWNNQALNGWSTRTCLCTRLAIEIQIFALSSHVTIWKLNFMFGFLMVSEIWTICHLTYFRLSKIQTCLDFNFKWFIARHHFVFNIPKPGILSGFWMFRTKWRLFCTKMKKMSSFQMVMPVKISQMSQCSILLTK